MYLARNEADGMQVDVMVGGPGRSSRCNHHDRVEQAAKHSRLPTGGVDVLHSRQTKCVRAPDMPMWLAAVAVRV